MFASDGVSPETLFQTQTKVPMKFIISIETPQYPIDSRM